jgi:hypothetical protein
MFKVMHDLMNKQNENIPDSSRIHLSFAVYHKENKNRNVLVQTNRLLSLKCVALLLPQHRSKDCIILLLLHSLSHVCCCPFPCVRKHYHLRLLAKEILITDVSQFYLLLAFLFLLY